MQFSDAVAATAVATAAESEPLLATRTEPRGVPERVGKTEPEGVDYGWVMQTTFVATIVAGAPLVAALSTTTALPTWTERALFAVRVGAAVWFVTALAVFLYARRRVESAG